MLHRANSKIGDGLVSSRHRCAFMTDQNTVSGYRFGGAQRLQFGYTDEANQEEGTVRSVSSWIGETDTVIDHSQQTTLFSHETEPSTRSRPSIAS
jgi:hypothetical protein